MPFKLQGFDTTIDELITYLDMYSLDQIQTMYQETAFSPEVQNQLREYLYVRCKRELM